jgi:hypothetical protein
MQVKYLKPIGMKISRLLTVVFLIVSLVSCQSDKEKAEKLIREHMFKTLLDFSSYGPMETTIDSAYTSIYTDSLILYDISSLIYLMENTYMYFQDVKIPPSEVEEWVHMFEDYIIEEIKKEMQISYDKYNEEVAKAVSLRKKIKERTENFESIFYGWQAKHKFRCRTKGGDFEIANYIFVFDPDYEKIIYHQHLEDKDYLKYVSLIAEIVYIDSEIK